jgi:hypothetical protein
MMGRKLTIKELEYEDRIGKLVEDLERAKEKIALLRTALAKVRDADEVVIGHCLCDHSDEKCCAKVGYPCHYCISDVALLAEVRPHE